MFAISSSDLIKTYKTANKREGIVGNLKDLFHRNYREVRAVDGISINIEQGEFVGFIGPNGAGKSTTIKMLTGILQPTSGEIRVLGFNPSLQRQEYTKTIGVVFGQRTQLWWDIAVKESFELLRRIYEIPEMEFRERLKYLIDSFQLSSLVDIPVRKLSLGERMKCDIVASLIHNPQILFLDEPTIGLDSIAKNSIRDILRKLHQETKTTILLTTHDLQEIEELCERILVLDKGHIVYDGEISDVRSRVNLTRTLKIELKEIPDVNFLSDLEYLEDIQVLQSHPKTIEVKFDSNKHTVFAILSKFTQSAEIKDISIEEPSIEEVITRIYTDGIN